MTYQSCGDRSSTSKLSVSDVAHTPVKRQSIGNCWLYAASTWAESLHLSATGQSVDMSESYWTYWDWHYKIVGSKSKSVNTAGSWFDASRIIARHGYMLEGDFIPSEVNSQMSAAQKAAEEFINRELSSGSLQDPKLRTPDNVTAALDAAFGVSMATMTDKIQSASTFTTSVDRDGTKYSLADEVAGGRHSWTPISYPQLFGQNPRETIRTRRQRAQILQRVLRAVNDKKPVIMSTMVEFSALNINNAATFEYDLYLEEGYSSGQGGHLLVLEDYVVDNVPGVGTIGEGDVNPQMKAAALRGDVRYLVAKNSWGTDRPDRGLSDGYTRFTMDYLNRPLPFGLSEEESDISRGSWYSALSQFVVPPGY